MIVKERKEIFRNIYLYLVCIFLILGSKDTWISAHDDSNMYMYIGMGSALLLLVLGVIQQKFVESGVLKIIVVLTLIVLGSMVVNSEISGYSMIIVFVLALFCVTCFSEEQFYMVFENTVFLITLLTLALTAIWKVFPESEQAINFFIHLRSYDTNSVPWGFRLYGIFREPAMYCIYLGLALIRCLLYPERKNYMKSIIYLIAIFLTGSTTGYIATAFIILCYVFNHRKNKIVMSIFLLGIAGCLFYLTSHDEIVNYFLSKISTSGANAVSSNSRYYSILGGAIVGILNPFFGAGAIGSEEAFNQTVETLAGTTYCWANMVTYLWASFGSIFVFIFLYGLSGIMVKRGKKYSFEFLISAVLLMCGETMTYSTIMYIFMLYGYKNLPSKIGKTKRTRII